MHKKMKTGVIFQIETFQIILRIKGVILNCPPWFLHNESINSSFMWLSFPRGPSSVCFTHPKRLASIKIFS